MALIKIEYGSVADSATLNDNFNYLDERITDTAVSIATLQSNISSVGVNANAQLEIKATEIATNMESMKTELDETIAGVSDVIGANGLYITTYVSGSSWYREYFSNVNKTVRVWLEQGGKTGGGSTGSITVTLLKSFSNTNYNIQITSVNSGQVDLGKYNYYNEAGATSDKAVNKFTINWIWGGRYWYVCGK